MSELKAETQALLDLGRDGDDPSEAAVTHNRRALSLKVGAAALGTGAVAGTATKAAAASTSGWLSAKVLALCGSVVVGGATLAAVHAWQREPITPVVASAVAVAPAAPEPARDEPELSAQAEQPLAPELAPSTLAAPPKMASSEASGPRSIQRELELVRGAQRKLHRSDARGALALLAEHARRFPGGALSEEREASRVFALCRLGDVAAARAQAERFLRRSANSPFAERVRASCRSSSP